MNTAVPLPPSLKQPGLVSVVVIAACAVTFWLWSCFCSFPMHPWNAIRIAPSFMWSAGVTPYPGPGLGPVTTWIYGPVPLFLQWPATWAADAASALVIAGTINVLIMVVPVALVVLRDLPTPVEWPKRLLALLLVFALWPAANLIFWQADNVAVALGFVSIALLKDIKPEQTSRLWLAGAAATLALWSKPTEVGPALGQIAWLGLCFGLPGAIFHVLRCAACGASAGLVFFLLFGTEGVLYNMFVVPAGLPLVPLWAKAIQAQFLPQVVLCVVLPALIVLATIRRVLKRHDTISLCYLVFLASLPFNLLGFASTGGNINSLHAHLYLLPALASALLGFKNRSANLFVPAALALIALGIGFHLASANSVPLKPATSAAIEAETLSREFEGRLYLPWQPLATFYAEGRFDHIEDGIMTRALAGQPVSTSSVKSHLPPAYSMVGYQEFIYEGFVTRHLVPAEATQYSYGNWRVLSWPLASSPAIATDQPLKFAPDEPTSLDPSISRP